jgi:hypothetical protein
VFAAAAAAPPPPPPHEDAEGCIDVSFGTRAHCHRGFRVWLQQQHMKKQKVA